jgi:glutathione S-transferase
MLRLNTFVISHFSEKVRWVLDVEGASYEERALLPGLHVLTARRLAEHSTLPILEHDSHVVQGSSAIVDYLSAELGFRRFEPPASRAARSAELEELADHALGKGVQRIAYGDLLHDRKTLTKLWSLGNPFWGRAFYALAYPGVARAVKSMYKITPETVSEAKQRFRAAMTEFDRALQDQPYLTGATPCRADLALAALLAPLSRPPEHRVSWPELPAPVRAFTRDFEGRPTWNHALKMYREHRGPPAKTLST